MKKIYAIGIGAIIMASCATSNQVVSNKLIQKRKYNKGWHVNATKSYDKSSVELEEEVTSVIYTDVMVQEETAVFYEVEEGNSVVANSSAQSMNYSSLSDENNSTNNSSSHNSELMEVNSLVTNSYETQALQVIQEENITQFVSQKENKKSSNSDDDMLILLYILAILIPFVAVGIVTDWDLTKVLINILLCFLCYIPGVIHAFITIRDYYR